MAGSLVWQSGASQVLAMTASGQGVQVANAAALQLVVDLDNRGVSGGPSFFGYAQLLTSQSGFGGNMNANTTIDLYLVPSISGSVFPVADTAGAVLPAQSFKGSFVVTVSGNAAAAASSVYLDGPAAIPLLPLVYRGYIKNNTGQTLTSGWAVFVTTHNNYYN